MVSPTIGDFSQQSQIANTENPPVSRSVQHIHIIVSPSVTEVHAQLLLERRDEVLLVRKSLPFPSELKVFLERVEEGSRKHFSTLAPTMRQVPEHELVILNLEEAAKYAGEPTSKVNKAKIHLYTTADSLSSLAALSNPCQRVL